MDKRLNVIKIIIFMIFILLFTRAAQLQLLKGDYYQALSDGNRVSLRPINAPRGKIIDRDNNILVSNKLSYNLYFLPNEKPPEYSVEKILKTVSNITVLKKDRLQQNYKENIEKKRSSSAILLKRNISPETMVIIEENSEDIPGILVKESSIRDYVYGDIAAHVLGYVGEISESELKRLTSQGYNYNGRDMVGITGLEKEYETYLKGTDGVEQIEVNNLGQKVKTLGKKPPVQGNNLVLNLDLNLQQKTEDLLEKKFQSLCKEAEADPELDKPTGAAAIVMEVNSGEVLSMASIPNFDLNNFAIGFTNSSYQKLINDPLNPLLNRPIMGAVPPGSIFKLVTGTTAIENLNVNAETEFVDKNGKFYIPEWSRPFRNWHERGEGKLDFTRAIARSNNIIFYKLGYDLYKKYRGNKLTEYAREYGLGKKTGIDLPGEKSGLVPDREWKKETFNEGWYPGDSVNLSIGQGGLLTTPIQLVNMICSIANGGTIYQPYIVDKIVDREGNILRDNQPRIRKRLKFDDRVYKILREGMTEVTNSSYGTARSVFRDFPVKVAGKTGTAQTSISKSNHGWFVGFAPIDKPEIAILVFLENGNSSVYTLPVAAGIFKEYFGFNEEDEVNEQREDTDEIYKFTRNRLIKFFKDVFSKEE